MKKIKPITTSQYITKGLNGFSGRSHRVVLGDLYDKKGFEKSFFGYHTSVLKSGIQKYGRRAEVEKGRWCLLEMDSFSLLEWNGQPLNAYLRKYPERERELTKSNAIKFRSNMVNRLVVMMSEEVNISAWWMPSKIYELYQNWWKYRNSPVSRKYLIDMYYYLTSQMMIRLISDLKSVYVLPPDYVKAKQMNDLIQIHAGIEAQYPQIYSGLADIGNVLWKLNARKYPPNLQPHIDGIIYNLEKGSDNVFYWISKLCEIERNEWISKKKKGKFKCKYLKVVWEILHGFIDRHDEHEFVRATISTLEFFFNKMTHKEKPIYLYHAVLLLVRRNEIDWNSTDPVIDTPSADVDKLYREHLAGGKMPMDDYILDLHTNGGKRDDDCLENFALKGAYIENENVKFLCREYREIYVLLKQELDRYRCNGGRLL